MTRASITITLFLLLTLAATSLAQSAPPFDMVGFIQQASVDSASNPLSGGYITINNHRIRVPANSIVQMPAATLSWGQVFSFAPAAYSNGGTQTGLAMSDSPKLPGTYEAHVLGNIVNGQYIAGLIFLSQQSLNVGQGFIDAIDYANGAIHVNGTILKINDPLGKFSKGDPNADPRFSIDEDNPTIRSETGYPMCVSRTDPNQPASAGGGDDPLCPQKNRPKDVSNSFALIFTMPPPGSPQGQPDVTQQAPFEVGDYITYAGVISADESYLSVYQINANVGIFTSPGVDPAYIAIDVLLQGTGGVPNPNFPQEATSKVKVEGFSTDPSRTVNIFARDTDCNGVVTTRNWVTDLIVDPGPPTGAKKGRFRFVPSGGTFLPPAREVLVKVGNGATNPTVANGLVAGQYFAPEFDFIFPENLAVGNPPVSLNLGDFVWLVNGIGPWAGGMAGQLNPWPDTTTPTPTCTQPTGGGGVVGGTAPTASAVANPSVTTPGQTVTLDGSNSSPQKGLSYSWTQDPTDLTQVSLLNANTAIASFTAPSVSVSTLFHVTLKVTNSVGSSTATVTVTVSPTTTVTAPVARATATPNPAPSGTSVTLDGSASTDTNSPAQTLSYSWVQTAGPAVTISNPTAAVAAFVSPVLAAGTSPATLTFALTVRNTSGLSATTTVNVAVNPLPDSITITLAEYRKSKSRFTVNATDSVVSPLLTLTCTLDTINPATGQPYSGVMQNLGAGNYTIIFTGVLPTKVTVTSSGGGSASTSSITVR